MIDYRWNIKDAVKVFLFYILLMFIGMPVIIRFIHMILGHYALTPVGHRSVMLFVSLFSNISVCCYVLHIVCVKYHQSIKALGLSLVSLSDNTKHGIKLYLVTLPSIVLAGFFINWISSYYGNATDMQAVVRWVLEEQSTFILVSLLLFGIIIAPIIEEIIFRGFFQPALKNALGGRYAIVAGASLFAAVHMDAFAFLQIFILGILLGYLYEKTKTLAASIVVHILHNSLTLIFLLYFKFFFKGKIPVF